MAAAGAAPKNNGMSIASERIPPQTYFIVSARFHYLGPAFAILFANVAPLGVAWLRIAIAAAVFAAWREPWRSVGTWTRRDFALIAALGAVLAAMNSVFYLAISKLPLATVGAIEFLGPVALAAAGTRSVPNAIAFVLAVTGVAALMNVSLQGKPSAFVFAFANCALFTLYIMLGHRLARSAGGGPMDRLAAAMLVAAVLALPVGIADAVPAFADWRVFTAAVGVALSSSVIPYAGEQLAMRRLPRASYALFLSLLPAVAAAVGIAVLGQHPSVPELAGIALVVAAIALHQPAAQPESRPASMPESGHTPRARIGRNEGQ